jgi:2-oxoglutarate dehydrogenase E1 component
MEFRVWLWICVANPNTLTIWEAQFGDFSNGAQIMIDNTFHGRISGTIKTGVFYYCLMDMKDKVQSTRRKKWSYLQLCARQNMFVIVQRHNFSRWEGKWKLSSTKHLLCLHLRVCCVIQDAFLLLKNSKTEVFKKRSMMTLWIETDVKTLVFCTGKFYYELTAEREKET